MKTSSNSTIKIFRQAANIAGWTLLGALTTVVIGLVAFNSMTMPRARVQPAPRGPESRSIAELRQAGIAGDKSQILALLAALHTPPHPTARYTALHALAQIGAEEALPDFDPFIQKTIMQTDMDPDLSNFAYTAKARLLAESTTKTMPPGQERARLKMNKLLDETGVSINDLNRAPLGQNTQVNPTSLYALRELADMIYQKHDVALAQYAQAQGVQFSSRQDLLLSTPAATIQAQNDGTMFTTDLATALKVKLAPLSEPQRLQWLIDNLAQMLVMDSDSRFVIQLAIDQGLPASRAAAAKLKYMQSHPAQYQDHVGYAAMFDIISGVGDKQQLPLLEQFVNTPLTDELSRYNSHDAGIAVRKLQEGTTPTYAAGY